MATSLPVRLPVVQASPDGSDLLRERLRAKESDDLVFAVTGYIGSGTSWVAQGLIEKVKEAGFHPYEIKLSDLLAEHESFRRGNTKSIAETITLQDAGKTMRTDHGGSIVAGLGIRRIRELRRIRSDETPCAFVIDSLKHPAEVEVLRSIYGQSFYLIGVVCNEDTRKKRLKLKFKNESEKGLALENRIADLMARDREEEGLGQKVRKTLHLSDFFVANDNQSEEMLGDELWRFLQAVTGQGIVRPRKDEKGMHAAWSAALRSSCMSRQVGASIVSANGQLLSTGTNDPPSPKGGLYTGDDDLDHRCFKSPTPESGYCRNDRKKKEIYEEIFAKLKNARIVPKGGDEESAVPLLASAASMEDLVKVLKSTRIRDLIEFSRAVHAEMDALIAIAREGTHETSGASLYCTTYPCHSCARHIVAAGIREVVYIEPYDKSLANELHDDAMRDVSVKDAPEPESDPRVAFRLFGGVAPRRFATLFEKRRDLKDTEGRRIDLTDRVAHTDPILKGSFLTLEDDVATGVDEVLDGSRTHA